MALIKVTVKLPFLLRLENPLDAPYRDVCSEPRVPELENCLLHIAFSRNARVIDMSNAERPRTTVEIEVDAPAALSDESVGHFATRDCLKILNRIIDAYQAATGEVSNAGYIAPLGTSDMQLFADIRLDGKDVRDRWPSHSVNTSPLSTEQQQEFETYLQGAEPPLPRLFLTNAMLLLERGQYSLSIVQAATAAELRLTEYIRAKLTAARMPAKTIRDYEHKTLGAKLRIPCSDPMSLETYFRSDPKFPVLFNSLKDPLNKSRIQVVHHGHLASLEEAHKVIKIAREFLRLVV